MLPAYSDIMTDEGNFEELNEPSYTYRMRITDDKDDERILGFADELEAVKQAAYKIINTERYQYMIYSWDYGIELKDLFGEPVDYCIPIIQKRITEALLQDNRIDSVDSFTFNASKKHIVACTFTVHSVFGDFSLDKEVSV